MRNIAAVLVLALALPAAADDQELIKKVLDYHFGRTQPFFRGLAIVSNVTNEAPRPRLHVDLVVADPLAVEQLTEQLDKSREPLPLEIESTDRYEIVPLATKDWRLLAGQYPEKTVMFEVSRPLYDEASRHAVVRIQSLMLRGMHPGSLHSELYSAVRGEDGRWHVKQFVAPADRRD